MNEHAQFSSGRPQPGLPATGIPRGPGGETLRRPDAGIALGLIATVWGGLGSGFHVFVTLYLGFGATITHTLGGVFYGSDGGLFNWALLLLALAGQFAGLVVSVIALVIGIRAKRRQAPRSTTALTLGIVATSIFVLIGIIQLPLAALLQAVAEYYL